MPTNTAKALARGAFATSSATLYTTPSATTAVVTNIAVTNTAATNATFSLSLAGVVLFGTTTVGANSTVIIDLRQVLVATNLITGFASAITVNYHISGMETA